MISSKTVLETNLSNNSTTLGFEEKIEDSQRWLMELENKNENLSIIQTGQEYKMDIKELQMFKMVEELRFNKHSTNNNKTYVTWK